MKAEKILSLSDKQFSKLLRNHFKKKGIKVPTKATKG